MKFSITGANKETGEDVSVVLVAVSRHEAEVAAVHQGIMVSGIKLLPDEKKMDAISMDDDGPVADGAVDPSFVAAVGAKQADGHGSITLGANSPSDTTHTGAPGTHHAAGPVTGMEYHIIMNQALYLLETAVNKYLADDWEPAGGLTVGTFNNALQYFQAVKRVRKPGQAETRH